MRLRLPAMLAVALALGWGVRQALGRLDHARRDRAATVAAGTPPRIEGARPIVAATAEAARQQLARLLGDRASAAGVRLTMIPGDRRTPEGLAVLRLEASGSETALRCYAASVETAPGPMVRLLDWSIGADASGDLRLTAEAVAAWRA